MQVLLKAGPGMNGT